MIRRMNRAVRDRKPAVVREADLGFTMVELMVVIMIIGILAAIAVSTLLFQRQQALDASVKSDLSAVVVAAEAYSNDNGNYAGLTVSGLRTNYGLRTTVGNLFKIGTVTTTSYIVTAYNGVSGVSHGFTLTTGAVSGPATVTTITTSD